MLSIIVPVLNQHEMTRECIAAIQDHTDEYEIVLVDNGSDPPLCPQGGAWVLNGLAHRVIRNPSNLGFPVAVNQGIRASHGEAICLLNNDVIVTPGWAQRLQTALWEYSIVGPMTNYCAGIQRTTLPVYYDRKGLDTVAAEWARRRSGRILAVNWIIGFCFLFARSLYEDLGSFDESLWPCSGEEIDFCLRAKARGYSVGMVQDVYVHHEGSMTFRALGEDYAQIVSRNNGHLAKRWGENIWNEQLPTFIADAGIRLNLGCGRFKLQGFVNIDSLPRVEPDVLCDVMRLPYDPGTVDEIYAGHLLEHFSFSDGQKALSYWHSLLKPGGQISIAVPDYDAIIRDYLADPTPRNLRETNDLYIYSEHQESHHRYMYSPALLEEVMREAGFVDLERMRVDHPYFPVAVPWQVGFHGRKARHADQ